MAGQHSPLPKPKKFYARQLNLNVVLCAICLVKRSARWGQVLAELGNNYIVMDSAFMAHPGQNAITDEPKFKHERNKRPNGFTELCEWFLERGKRFATADPSVRQMGYWTDIIAWRRSDEQSMPLIVV